MTVYKNGKVIKEIPVTTGKPGFDTRNGIKVSWARSTFVRMRSASVGIARQRDSYDLTVHWATRVTWSGEYVHAAPWSAGSQGYANVSHGCTGMSTEQRPVVLRHRAPRATSSRSSTPTATTWRRSATASATGTCPGRSGSEGSALVGRQPGGQHAAAGPGSRLRPRPESRR